MSNEQQQINAVHRLALCTDWSCTSGSIVERLLKENMLRAIRTLSPKLDVDFVVMETEIGAHC